MRQGWPASMPLPLNWTKTVRWPLFWYFEVWFTCILCTGCFPPDHTMYLCPCFYRSVDICTSHGQDREAPSPFELSENRKHGHKCITCMVAQYSKVDIKGYRSTSRPLLPWKLGYLLASKLPPSEQIYPVAASLIHRFSVIQVFIPMWGNFPCAFLYSNNHLTNIATKY